MSIKQDFLANWPNYASAGMKIPQIAEVLGCSENTLKVYLQELKPEDRANFVRPYHKKNNERKISNSMYIEVPASANKKIKELKKKVKEKDDALNAEHQLNASLTEANKRLREEVTRLEKVLAAKHASILTLSQKVADNEAIELAYQEEVNKLEKKLSELEEDYKYLQSTDTTITCSEEEHYTGELKDALVEAVEAFLPSLAESSNYRRLLEEFLLENPPTETKAKLEKALERSKTVSSSKEFKSILESVGFEFTRQNRSSHFKCRWMADPRYQITIARTSSDKRAYQNTSSDIRKLIF